MKKILYVFLIIILILSVAVGAFACKKKIATGKEYHLYTYDSRTDSFVKMGASLTFGENFESFEYSFSDGGLRIYGGVDHTEKPDAYVITCSEEVLSLVTDQYRESLQASGADETQIAFYEAIADGFTPRAQYFSYDGKLFTGDSVELFREASDDSDSFEGVYRMDSSENLVRFRGGFVYAQDEDGNYTEKTGKYTVSRGILTLISVDEDGKDRYQNGILMRKRYFMAKITIPSEAEILGTDFEEQLKSSAFASKINQDISDYSEKTIAVLCKSFLSYDMK